MGALNEAVLALGLYVGIGDPVLQARIGTPDPHCQFEPNSLPRQLDPGLLSTRSTDMIGFDPVRPPSLSPMGLARSSLSPGALREQLGLIEPWSQWYEVVVSV